jgi:hypothetical protein
MNKEIGIFELVKGVHEELTKIKDDVKLGESPLFSLKNLELNLNVAISKATEAGIKFFIVSADRKVEKEQTSSIKLSFEPLVQARPRKVKIAQGTPILASPIAAKRRNKSQKPNPNGKG